MSSGCDDQIVRHFLSRLWPRSTSLIVTSHPRVITDDNDDDDDGRSGVDGKSCRHAAEF